MTDDILDRAAAIVEQLRREIETGIYVDAAGNLQSGLNPITVMRAGALAPSLGAALALAKAASKVAEWLERQATIDEAKAAHEKQFMAYREALLADAKNYRKMAGDIRAPEAAFKASLAESIKED